MTDKWEIAKAVLLPMMGENFSQAIQKAANNGFGAPLARLAIDYAFADVWSRPGLGRRERSIATMAILITAGQSHELKTHVRAALANGCTPTEIEELIVHAGVYAGLPAAGMAMQVAGEVLREKGILPSATDKLESP